jgi:hypothetical protein
VAQVNGIVTGLLAVLSAPFALFGITGLVVTVALAVIAYNEFRGRRKLLRFEPAATAILGWNQLGLLTLIVGYCSWMIYRGLTGPSSLAAIIEAIPELESAFGSPGDAEQLQKLLVVVVYGLVIALSLFIQGLNAAYYFTRRKFVEAYLKETRAWVLEVQRITSSI